MTNLFSSENYYDPGRDFLLSLLHQSEHHHVGPSSFLTESTSSMLEDSAERNSDLFLKIITRAGIITSLCVILSPVTSMYRVISKGRVGRESALPYFMLFSQAYLWMWYGFYAYHSEIAMINGVGSLASFFYLLILGYFADQCDRITSQYLLFTGVVSIILLSMAAGSIEDEKIRMLVFVYGALTCNIGLYIVPLFQTYMAVKNLSLDGFPTGLTVAGFVSSALWAIYSILMHSLPYLIPNLIGVLFNGIQMGFVVSILIRSERRAEEVAAVKRSFDKPQQGLLEDDSTTSNYGSTEATLSNEEGPEMTTPSISSTMASPPGFPKSKKRLTSSASENNLLHPSRKQDKRIGIKHMRYVEEIV